MLRHIMRHDWRMLGSDNTLRTVGLLLVAAIAYGSYNGASWVRFQRQTLQAASSEERQRYEALKLGIVDANAGRTQPPSFSDPRQPAAVGRTLGPRYAQLPPAPLASFAIGQTDLYPYYVKVSTLNQQTFLNNDEIEHPLHLLSGRFDLAFVVLYLYPLVILVLTYNLISAEREAGTLAMTLSHPVTLRTLVTGKVVLRFCFVVAVAVVFALLGGLFGGMSWDVSGTLVRLFLWACVVAVYGGFWFGLGVVVSARGSGSASNAMTLAGFWLLFVLLIPSLLNVAVTTAHPAPSRVELINAMRHAANDANSAGSRLLARYLEDHPEFAGDAAAAADSATITAVTQDRMAAAMQPVLHRFDAQLEQQQKLVNRWRILSPAIIAQSALYEIAGAGVHRHRHFLDLAADFHRRWRAYFYPRILRKETLAAADVDRIPAFTYAEEADSAVIARAGADVMALGALSLVLLGVGFGLLRRYSIAE